MSDVCEPIPFIKWRKLLEDGFTISSRESLRLLDDLERIADLLNDVDAAPEEDALDQSIYSGVEAIHGASRAFSEAYHKVSKERDSLRSELSSARAQVELTEAERAFFVAALIEFEGNVERDDSGAIVPRYQRLREAHAALIRARPEQCAANEKANPR